jgi:6-phosphofructokinase 1
MTDAGRIRFFADKAMIKRIGILTSGGDAPGMNAAIRAAVRTAIAADVEIYGIRDGYLGLHQDRISRMNTLDVTNIIGRGGSILGSARFRAFEEESVRREAIENLRKREIDSLVVIGGDGSYTGALRLTEMGFPCIGVPGTIDNDVHGTDFSIGFDTALNTIVECIDRLRDTSNSHKRVNIVEVMGRHCGDLCVSAAIAGGADFAIVPEQPFDSAALFRSISQAFAAGKRHGIVTLCENITNAELLANDIEGNTGIECRATVLGHIQRGGVPSAQDRILGSRLGELAVKLLIDGIGGQCVGIVNGELTHNGIAESIKSLPRKFDAKLAALPLRLA